MKARVKATGEIVTIKPCEPLEIKGLLWPSYEDEYGRKYPFNALEENTQSQDSPDYWTRLEHQYAGMAMQGILSNPESELDYKDDETLPQALAGCAAKIAHALVEKLKEKEEREC